MAVTKEGLSLRFWDLLYKDPGYRLPASVSVIISIVSNAFTNPESHAHLSFVDIVAIALNMADTMRIFRFAGHINNTFDRQGSWTFCTFESKVPTFTRGASIGSKSTTPVYTKCCLREVFPEHTFLCKKGSTTIKIKLNSRIIMCGYGKSEKQSCPYLADSQWFLVESITKVWVTVN